VNTPSRRIGLALWFYCTAKGFDYMIAPCLPSGKAGVVIYFGAAATVDWSMFYRCQRFVTGKLRRDMEALCIASIAVNCIGFLLYMAPSPPLPYPGFYVWAIQGINYVLAIRLLLVGDGNALHHFFNSNWLTVVRRAVNRYLDHTAKEKKS
jgi:hypothetical protein